MDTNRFKLKSLITGDSDEDTSLLKSMAAEAESYLSRFKWCPPIKKTYFAGGIGGIVGVFLIELEHKIGAKDNFLWVVVGDLPSAYFVTDNAETPKAALEIYCNLMIEWVNAVKNSKSTAGNYPIEVEPTIDNARSLEKRLQFLRQEVIPGLA